MYKYFARQYPVYYVLLFEINYLAWCWFPFVFFLKGWCQFLCLLLAQNHIFDLHTKKTVTLSWKPGGLIHVLALAIRAPRYKGQISSLTEVVRFYVMNCAVLWEKKKWKNKLFCVHDHFTKDAPPETKIFLKLVSFFILSGLVMLLPQESRLNWTNKLRWHIWNFKAN